MPGMNGQALAEKIRALRPGTPVVFMSGYTGNGLVHRGLVEEDMKLLVKPFSAQVLADTVRAALGKGSAGKTAGQ